MKEVYLNVKIEERLKKKIKKLGEKKGYTLKGFISYLCRKEIEKNGPIQNNIHS